MFNIFCYFIIILSIFAVLGLVYCIIIVVAQYIRGREYGFLMLAIALSSIGFSFGVLVYRFARAFIL